ncbi:protein-serine O-palmitoleoyltransferase porcupine isoform X2 [Daktulosphaira vitifoliae]|uniref:protein-serine O-palmitoleoyltransferase porcupine isoform X2 n=1 Tax=Daktulosphaira vitifoliae TaxID=58002 RepID=UPI0021AA213B|nr:protein-serine O-palmitoleoyltransferase porcupine isoform X2 [Daktulosphaira vitifoliae]
MMNITMIMQSSWVPLAGKEYESISMWDDFYQLTNHCAFPAVWKTFRLSGQIGVTLLTSLCFRIFILIFCKFRCFPMSIMHLTCAICGLLPVLICASSQGDNNVDYWWFPATLIVGYVIILYIISYSVILIGGNHTQHKNFTSAIIFFAIILLLLIYREYVLDNSRAWQSSRGTHMLMSMKSVALIWDLNSGHLKKWPTIIEYMGYMMCAGCTQFGPYISYKQYLNAYRPLSAIYIWSSKKWIYVTKDVVLSVLWFMGSICYIDWLLDTSNYTNYGIAIAVDTYRRAASYRCGHYFVGAVGSTNAHLCGFINNNNEAVIINKPSDVEWPKKMSYVASSWDIPTHQWLKLYVFDKIYKFSNAPTGAAVTYIISCAIHGFEIRVSAVLAMIGGCSYVELLMRRKLFKKYPTLFVKDNKLKKNSSSKVKKFFQTMVNLSFTILNIFYLAYLGAVMESSTDTSESPFFVWHRCLYAGHVLLLLNSIIILLL